MYCNQRSQYIRPISKKNSFRGNYSRKYGICIQLCSPWIVTRYTIKVINNNKLWNNFFHPINLLYILKESQRSYRGALISHRHLQDINRHLHSTQNKGMNKPSKPLLNLAKSFLFYFAGVVCSQNSQEFCNVNSSKNKDGTSVFLLQDDFNWRL